MGIFKHFYTYLNKYYKTYCVFPLKLLQYKWYLVFFHDNHRSRDEKENIMSGIFDNEVLDIECPQCKENFRKSVGKLKSPGVKCPKCGVRFETSQFRRDLDKVDRSIKDFERSIKDIKIDIKL